MNAVQPSKGSSTVLPAVGSIEAEGTRPEAVGQKNIEKTGISCHIYTYTCTCASYDLKDLDPLLIKSSWLSTIAIESYTLFLAFSCVTCSDCDGMGGGLEKMDQVLPTSHY